MVLIQREAQLSQLRTAFDACAGLQGGRVCLISGAVGSGKTALLEAFIAHVTDGRGHLLSATGSQVERHLPFGVMDQLIDSSGLERASARKAATVVRHLALTTSPPGAPEDDALHPPAPGFPPPTATSAAYGLFTSLLDLAGPLPLVVTIDDVHHADAASLRCLLYAIRRLRHKQIMVLLTESPMLRTQHPHFRAELLSQPHVSRIGLEPLTDAALSRLARIHPVPSEARDRVAREAPTLTGGSPLLMRALLDESCATPSPAPDASAVPGLQPLPAPVLHGTFDQAVLRCLYRHEPEVRGAAQALAVLSRPAPLPVLGRLLGLSPEFTSQSLRLLRRSGLVSSDGLGHPRIVGAVLADLPTEERLRLHRRAAEVLHEYGAEPGVVAAHLVSADWAEPAWADAALHEAAAQALEAGRPDVTAACLRLARGAVRPGTRWTEADTLLLRSRWQINPLAAATDLGALTELAGDAYGSGHDAEATATGTGTADQRYGPETVGAVPPLLWHGRPDTACRIVRTVAAQAHPAPDVRARLDAARLLISLVHPDRYPQARADARHVADVGTATSVTGRHLDAMTLLADTLTPDRARHDTVSNAELMIQRYMADEGALGALVTPLLAMLYAGRPDLVVAWTQVLLRRPSVGYAPSWKAVLHAIHAEAGLRLGALVDAGEHARTALTVLTPQAWGVAVAGPLSTLIGAATEAGRHDEAERWLAKPVPAESFRTPLGLHYLLARARYHLATGRRRAAADDLRWCGKEVATWRLDTATLVPWRLELARVHLAFGDHCEAVRLLEEQLDVRRSVDDRTRGMALRVLAGLVPPERGGGLRAQAVQLLEACGDRIELARALADTGQALRKAGDDAGARPYFQRAGQLAQGAGSPALAQRTARAAADLPLCPRPRDGQQHSGGDAAGTGSGTGLSRAERRVAALAAQGHTNRQISSKLFITVSTVEQHLTRVYRKLDVKQRTDLANRLSSVRAGVPRLDG
ncbi:helix-turn-helix transcriptional regulator [Streptomyces sp. WMMC1477]|uniref:helix-turn-helix transcriptional regulator n=1 Tax=Streptomyces sp. WMMC1477 TaxID=3015155 RepID=UPI0022B66D69|nr:LuxR family transcriptional regulator [Streptomyces sp. WMMC1477]MCZ7433045.1 AAA family ATPase [Streptomyces sp. WMMC1477]